MSATAPPVISVELPEPFDARWSRLPGVAIEGHVITIDPVQYFFRFDSSSWLVCDWDGVREELLDGIYRDSSGADQSGFHPRSRSDN
jgi:hypothetical protein